MEKRRGGAEEVMSPVPDPPQAEEPQPTRHASTASLSLERLPDDVLVLVLRYLDVGSLLACRLVCKRLGALALHGDAWRHRVVGGFVGGCACVCPELRLAPCVRVLCFYTELHDRVPCREAALAWTRCAAAELCLEVSDGSDNALAAAALINRQQALGRLKSLRVELYSSKPAVISVLTETCASTHGLVKLEVEVWGGRLPTPFQTECTISAPSLRHFKCVLSPEMEPFVNLILAGHAATLETVDLNSEASGMFCVATVPLLLGLPKLTKLSCCNIPGVEAVAASHTLRKLELTVRTETEHRGAVAGAAALLMRAPQLREVKVWYSPCTADVGVDVIWALASSGRSPLESLEIENDGNGQYFCHLQELIAAMPSLLALRHLRVDVGGNMEKLDELALAITPATAPALRSVKLGLGTGLCGHACLHRDAFKTNMSKNPLLHLGLSALPQYCGILSCEACGVGCHEVMKKFESYDFYLFWHDFDTKCPQDHSLHVQWALS
ncbi:uncharacterized protein LOC113214181 isoform X3 [Frankliniella occidentalis]|uniref:Uncharacterized protein LOC113214181 isoform X3 n=1 Tax=Frankliniella occidentalis TaxID=133901 RepID=A0A9C6X6I1_FRAOC|nr:uncharacterized protein LOC113214181 isoform X3 [Frankliniella occidentalis]